MLIDQEMKIVRTFHPVGQGAFYSERFYDGHNTFNVAYDCGTLHVGNCHKNLVRQSFTKEDIVDCLFISHLDEDHISLVSTLKDSVLLIKKVVLPLIDKEKVMLLMFLSRTLGMIEVYEFWSMIHDAMNGSSTINDVGNFSSYKNENSYYEDKQSHMRPQLQFVIQNQNVRINPSIEFHRYNSRISPFIPDWIFVAYNKHIERQEELENNLKEIIADSEFQNALKSVGVIIKTVQDLTDALSMGIFVDIMGSQVIKKFLRKAYNDIAGTINSNSLLVYSGPTSEDHRYFSKDCPCRCFIFEHSRCHRFLLSERVACIYTGDSDLDIRNYRNEFQDLWNNVGTIQLPHHGSYASFQFDKNKNEFNKRYVFLVSCGETNPYGHPSSKVLDFLMANDCLPHVVTENVSTGYSQVILSR